MAGMLPAFLALSLVAPPVASAASTDPDLVATLEHSRGDIEYALELGTLHFFDEENAPFAVQVVDACAVNDHLWVFGVGLSGVSIPLSVMDLDTGKTQRIVLPAFEPGKPIGTILEPESLPLCGDEPAGGLDRVVREAERAGEHVRRAAGQNAQRRVGTGDTRRDLVERSVAAVPDDDVDAPARRIVREQSCVTAPVGLDGFDVVSLSEPALHDHRVARGHR